ncbi:MAG: hypothetical protein AAF697_02490 [Pseudomonadota bacterium]
MRHKPILLTALPLTLLISACDAPDPDDYGGGAIGEAVVKCIERTERADSAITRVQSGEMCTCITDKTFAALSGGGMTRAKMEREMLSCARQAGVEITD